jgi:signal transduction histidine kinase
LTSKLLRLQDDERRRLARELHDSVGQLLAATSMNLSAIARKVPGLDAHAQTSLTEATELVAEALKEIRIVSYLLHPPLLDDSGLGSALEWYLDGYSKRSAVAAELTVSDGFGRLPQEMETALFRIVQECLTNIHRHSGSPTAKVRLSRDAESVRLEVADSGKGMPTAPAAGVGLRGMRERIGQLGGRLEIRSSGAGTTIVGEIPLADAATG